ncbi:MAG: hypothetical protein SH820_12950 [Xanthomonadales bacterium]|nr:hypothetical protein [Xanthomonadales bacterium]
MNRVLLAVLSSKPLLFALVVCLCWSGAVFAAEDCDSAGEYAFVCGLVNPEDLVLVPNSNWIISSGMGAGGALYLVNAGAKTWSVLYPTDGVQTQQDLGLYPACPGAPDLSAFVTHGLNVQPNTGGHSTLYVVGHGAREAIEVFAIDATGDMPVLNWKGCILTPDGMAANSVASAADGSLLVTIPLLTGFSINEALAGKITGGVFKWLPGESGFTKIEGSGMPYANGIEVSADGSEFFVASSGMFNVTAFSNTDPARVLRRTKTFGFIPDNLHLSSEGELITAGMNLEDPSCGNLDLSQEFDLGKFASCPRPFTVWAINPQSMQGRALATSLAIAQFSNITMALSVGGELWIGTFGGDRIGYRSLEHSH